MLLLVSVAVVVSSLSGGRGPYAELPSCRTLFPFTVRSEVPAPGTGTVMVTGSYEPESSDVHIGFGGLQDGLLGRLTCLGQDSRTDTVLLTMDVYLHDPADPGMNDKLLERFDVMRSGWESGSFEETNDVWVGHRWRDTEVADAGMVGVFDDVMVPSFRDGYALSHFVTDNIGVYLGLHLYGPYDKDEILDSMEELTRQIDDLLRTESIPA
ncbi:hypothetical protein [Nocardiopsis valliformis]|uniref:hypothetical protein n=1 Tax=Nocardiopsis valliformis TaxID=239974 RepID=UPI00034A3F8A|nr:hypothetical protein [Nocardiopsis valliformis]